MHMNRLLRLTIVPLGFMACSVTSDTSHTIAVTEANDLGIVRLQTDRFEDQGNTVFELSAWSESQRVGSVRLTIGTIPELPPLADDDSASEILVSVAGSQDLRMV